MQPMQGAGDSGELLVHLDGAGQAGDELSAS